MKTKGDPLLIVNDNGPFLFLMFALFHLDSELKFLTRTFASAVCCHAASSVMIDGLPHIVLHSLA